MLKQLFINNYALIEVLEAAFHPGFSVITGETGAGKSIILGALALVLGNRADTRVLMDQNKKCIVEAAFDTTGYDLEVLFESNDLDYEKTTLLRREINPQGKSRAFINDSPVKLNVLKEFGERLVDVFSQHGLVQLKDPEFQLSVVDNFAGLGKERQEFIKKFDHFAALKKHLAEMEEKEAAAVREQDYYSFLLEELQGLDPEAGEQQQLEENRQIWTHAEEIKSSLYQGYTELTGDESNITNRLNHINKNLEKLGTYHPAIPALSERLQSAIIELEDLSREMEKLYNETDFDPAELERLNERLDQIYKLEQKHRVQTVEELIELKDSFEEKLEGFSSLSQEVNALKDAADEQEGELNDLAAKLSERRKQSTPGMEQKVSELLARMGMPDGRIEIAHHLEDKFSRTGADTFEFRFTANPGIPPQSLARVASGGELSRLMLAIKSLISEKNLLPTIIFDEIDNGISGDISGKVGEVMRAISANMQVIAITHLPQIAGKGHHHYRVFKVTGKDMTRTRIEPVEGDARVEEITKMFGGDQQSPGAKKAAKEFLQK
jgi:DNA repair protein RecN (Recombination protein N)